MSKEKKHVKKSCRALEKIEFNGELITGREVQRKVNDKGANNCMWVLTQEKASRVPSDLQMSELKDFILDLETGDFKVITDSFLPRMPKLSHTVKVDREDGSSFEAEITGLASFL